MDHHNPPIGTEQKGISPSTMVSSLLRSIFFIKSVHTLIFLFFASCIGVVVYSALTGWITGLTWIAFWLVIAEAAIFVGFGWRCPLTLYAEKLGAKNGSVADIFLPLWFAKRLPVISSVIFATATLVVLLRSL
jgi:hypothetical protein